MGGAYLYFFGDMNAERWDYYIMENGDNWLNVGVDPTTMGVPGGASFVITGVASGSQVRELMVTAAQNHPRVIDDPSPVCQIKNFGDHAIEMELRFWISDPENGIGNVNGAVRLAVWDAFKANGIEIPFPQRVVHKKD